MSERKGTITKLVQYKGKHFKSPNTVMNAAGAVPNYISDKFELKSIKNSLISSKRSTYSKSRTANPDFTKKSERKEATIFEKSTLGKKIVLYNSTPHQPL